MPPYLFAEPMLALVYPVAPPSCTKAEPGAEGVVTGGGAVVTGGGAVVTGGGALELTQGPADALGVAETMVLNSLRPTELMARTPHWYAFALARVRDHELRSPPGAAPVAALPAQQVTE